jgi:flavin reductase (DIM6/NTAB) family NADH-FMN oxidoreductase RutF
LCIRVGFDDVSEALAHVPLPVVVVGAAWEGRRSCSTGTLTYVSYSPPLVATPLNAKSRTYALVRASGAFSLSLLAEDQAELAVRAAAPSDGDKFAEQRIPVLEPPDGAGAPAVEGAAAVLWCELDSTADAGGNVLCIGRVGLWSSRPHAPLLRLEHRYRGIGAVIDVEDEAPYPL